MRKWLALVILVICVAQPQAQAPAWADPQAAAAFGSGAAPGGANPAASPTTIDLLVGRSTVLNVGAPIARVSLTVPDIADAMVTAPQQLLIHGKAPGTISLFVWDKSGGIRTYEVVVRRDLSSLSDQLRQLFPGEEIAVYGSGKDVVVSGTVSSKYVVEKAAEVASGYVEKKDNVVNLLKQQEGVASNQVLLRVRFAEVSRSALQELGASWFTGPTGYEQIIARATTQQFAAPNYSELNRIATLDNDLTSASGKYELSDFLNLFIFSNKYNLGAVIRALSQKGLFQSLAEPNLVATNGKEASFLAGGEFPYPIVQAGATGNAVTITFKEFGIRLNFTPTILNDDVINLKVRPEVSALDFTNAVVVEGFRVPALSTRRTETEVELRDGQTFAVAGLLNNTVTTTMRKIPGIGDIPILGWLFKSRALQKAETELVVIITPHILRRGSPGAATGLPNPVEPFLGRPSKQLPPPPAHLGSPRYPMQGQQGPTGPASPSEAPNAASDGTAPTMQPQPAPPQVARPAARPAQTSQPSGQQAPAGGTSAPPRGESRQMPSATPTPGTVTVTPVPVKPAAAPTEATTVPAPVKLTKAQEEAIESARRQEKQQREADAKQAIVDARNALEGKKRADEATKKANEAAAKQAIEDARKAAADRKVAEARAREQAKRDAEAARKAEEARKKQAEEDAKRNKAIADAAARLREAQAAYQAAVQKTSADKPRPPQ